MLVSRSDTRALSRPAAAILALFAAAPAFAHAGHGLLQGFDSGLAHPLTGLDHMLAMVGVGVWAAQLGGRARWAVPAAFVAFMLAGTGLALAGIGLPLVEGGVAASVLVFGLIIATAFRAPLAAGMCLSGAFALFHGHAHGNEIVPAAGTLAAIFGFAISTVLLHLVGLGLGAWLTKTRSMMPARVAGGLLAATGCVLLTQLS